MTRSRRQDAYPVGVCVETLVQFIEDMPESIKKLRGAWLTDFDGSDLAPEAEEYFMLALSALEQAERFAKLAVHKTRQARRGR